MGMLDQVSTCASTSMEMITGRICSILLGKVLHCLPLGILQNVWLVWLPSPEHFSISVPLEAVPCQGQPKSGGITSNSMSTKFF